MTRPRTEPANTQKVQHIQYRPDPLQPVRWIRPRIEYKFAGLPSDYEAWRGEPTGWVEVEMDPTDREHMWKSKWPINFMSPDGFAITPYGMPPMLHIELTCPPKNGQRPAGNVSIPAPAPFFRAQLQEQFVVNGATMQLPGGSNQSFVSGMGPCGPPMIPQIMFPPNMNPQIMGPQIMGPRIMDPQIMNPQNMRPQIMYPQNMNPQNMNPQNMQTQIMVPEIMHPQPNPLTPVSPQQDVSAVPERVIEMFELPESLTFQQQGEQNVSATAEGHLPDYEDFSGPDALV